jgi:EAL domain-containing protein (putative c-di-GMP-specific phosphodiesterase class I)
MLVLKQDRFDMAYQPIYSAKDRHAPVGYEALLRVEAASPLLVLGLARKLDLLKQLERKVLERILSDSAAMPRERLIFVNASRDALVDSKWFDLLRRFCHGVVVEVQERNLRDSELKVLSRYRDYGIGIALDDLGQSLDDFEALEQLQPAYIKTDRCLVTGSDSQTLKRLKGIAHGFGAKLVVEGIETEEQHQLYRPCADLVQGYYYARPHPIQEVI